MTIRFTQPDAAADALPLVRTVLGCVEGRLDAKPNHTSVVPFLRLVRGFAAHGLAGHLSERRPASGRAAPASVSSGMVGLDRLREAMGRAFEAAFEARRTGTQSMGSNPA